MEARSVVTVVSRAGTVEWAVTVVMLWTMILTMILVTESLPVKVMIMKRIEILLFNCR